MGDKLLSYFDKAKEKGGVAAQVKLAILTKMSSATAKEALDSVENINMFENALKEL